MTTHPQRAGFRELRLDEAAMVAGGVEKKFKDVNGDGKYDSGDVIVVTANVEFKQVTEDNPGGVEWTYTDSYGAQYVSMEQWDLATLQVVEDATLNQWLRAEADDWDRHWRETQVNWNYSLATKESEVISTDGWGNHFRGERMTNGTYFWDTNGDGRMDTHTRTASDGTHEHNPGNGWVPIDG